MHRYLQSSAPYSGEAGEEAPVHILRYPTPLLSGARNRSREAPHRPAARDLAAPRLKEA